MDYYTSFFAGAVWFLIGVLATYTYMKNKESSDPSSLRDEYEALRVKYDDLVKHIIPGRDTKFKDTEVHTVEVKADEVKVFSERSTAPDSGAKTFGLGEEIDNDEVLGLKKTHIGEADPEATLPLKRGLDGKLKVKN